MKDKILILGKGYIGTRLQEEFDCRSSDKKIYSPADIDAEIEAYKPKVIINCVANIGRNVDDCEIDKNKTLIANSFVPIIVAESCIRNKIKLVHISTGCIYHYDYKKDRPITEEDIPDYFELFYSRSKIYSELALKALSSRYPILIARLRVPLDSRPHPKNTLTKLISFKRVINLANSVTYIPDFLKALKFLMHKNRYDGIYNIVNKGGLRYPQLLDVYKKYVPDFRYQVIDFRKLKLNRTNLIMSTRKLGKAGFKTRNIKDVLEECVKEYVKYS